MTLFATELRLRNTETLSERFRSVFGDFWLCNFLFPAVLMFRQEEDGTEWPKLKIHYRKQEAEHKDL